MIDLSSMNKSQQEAVLWNRGPLLVLAGPGSGKTRVLTYRIASILDNSAEKHFRILALTFTNKAAAEMRGRVEELAHKFLSRVRITTFHSYAAELLQQYGSNLGVRPDFQILSDDTDRENILDEVLTKLRKRPDLEIPEHFQATSLLPFITKLLEQAIAPESVEGLLKRSQPDTARELAFVYAGYREELKTSNSMDFPSLIAETLSLLEKFPLLSQHIRKIYTHILVDEFQDTNSTQYRLLHKIISPDPSTFFVVADDDQIIYQWNGADPKRLESLKNDFAIEIIQLPENYRCPPEIITLANALIANNLDRSPNKKPLVAIKPNSQSPVDAIAVYKFASLDDEIGWIANEIAQKSQDERENCVILARTNKLLEAVGTKLKAESIPIYFTARKNEFKSAPFRMLHAILRLANTSGDKKALAKLCKAFYELEGVNLSLSKIISRASASGEDFLRAWVAEAQEHGSLARDTQQLLTGGIKPLLVALNFSAFSKELFAWAKVRQNSQQLDEAVFNEFEEEALVWEQIFSEITKKFSGEDISLHQFLHELDLTSKSPAKEKGAIPCFSIHASKGMEFGHVYLMGLVEDQLPSWAAVKKGDESLEMQEERRNCFVAITRAQEKLTLTFSERVFGWPKAPSRFLKEMGIAVEG